MLGRVFSKRHLFDRRVAYLFCMMLIHVSRSSFAVQRSARVPARPRLRRWLRRGPLRGRQGNRAELRWIGVEFIFGKCVLFVVEDVSWCRPKANLNPSIAAEEERSTDPSLEKRSTLTNSIPGGARPALQYDGAISSRRASRASGSAYCKPSSLPQIIRDFQFLVEDRRAVELAAVLAEHLTVIANDHEEWCHPAARASASRSMSRLSALSVHRSPR